MPIPKETITKPEGDDKSPVVVKKYANRRLFNTESSSYITSDDLADMVRLGRDFVVYDAKSGDDITRGVLTQIIVEEEAKGQNLLPTNFLRQLIGLYGGSMQGLVPKYLEHAMTSFAVQQEQIRTAMQKTIGTLFPPGNIEEVGRQTMAMTERDISMRDTSREHESRIEVLRNAVEKSQEEEVARLGTDDGFSMARAATAIGTDMARHLLTDVEAESEAAQIYDRIHSELAAEEARADRLLQFYGL